MTIKRAVRVRLERLKRDMLHYVTWRRRERKLSGYLLRLAILLVLLVVLPVKKFVQLGLIGGFLALLKTGFAAAIVIGALALGFAVAEFLRRRRRGLSIREALA